MATRRGSASVADRIGDAKITHTSKNREQRNGIFMEDLRDSSRMIPPVNSQLMLPAPIRGQLHLMHSPMQFLPGVFSNSPVSGKPLLDFGRRSIYERGDS